MQTIDTFTDSGAAQTRMSQTDAWVQGGTDLWAAQYHASIPGWVSDLQTAVQTANTAVLASATTKQDDYLRAQLNYAAAIYRDTKYALMGRRRIKELGVNNMYREAYEQGRFADFAEFLSEG